MKKESVMTARMPLSRVVELYHTKELTLFLGQRGSVWTDGHRKRLITSVLLGHGMPEILVAVDNEGKYQLLDGQQRLTALTNYIKGVGSPTRTDKNNPRLPETFSNKTFSELPLEAQNLINNLTVRIEILEGYSNTEMSEIYAERNSGVKLKKEEILKGAYEGNFNSYLYGEAGGGTINQSTGAINNGTYPFPKPDAQALARCIVINLIDSGQIKPDFGIDKDTQEPKKYEDVNYSKLDKLRSEFNEGDVKVSNASDKRLQEIMSCIRMARVGINSVITSPLVVVSIFQVLSRNWKTLSKYPPSDVINAIAEPLNKEGRDGIKLMSTTQGGDSSRSNRIRVDIFTDFLEDFL